MKNIFKKIEHLIQLTKKNKKMKIDFLCLNFYVHVKKVDL